MQNKNLPLVNIIILTYNQFDFVGKCIDAVNRSNYKNIKLFLVDNNSETNKYKKFYSQYKDLKNAKFYRLKTNTGFAGGCNYALKYIKSGYVVLLNDDVMVTKNWLNPIINFMEENKEVGACQPKIKSLRHKEYFEYAGGAGGFMDVYGFPFARGRIFFDTEIDTGQYDSIVDLVWCSGACLVTRYSVIKKIGNLDEIFFMYGEEADWCWRMNYYGYRLTYIPKSVVYHYGSGTMGNNKFKKTYLHHRNGLILLLKNYSSADLFRYLPFRILLDYVAFCYYLFHNKLIANASAVIVAHLSVLSLIPEIYKRRKNGAFRRKDNSRHQYPLYKKSVVVDYFLKGKKKFDDLNFNHEQQN